MENAPYEGNKCVGRPQNYLSLQALYAVFTNKKSSILKEGRVPSKQLRSSGVLMEVNQVSCHMSHLLYLGCVPFPNRITKVKCGHEERFKKVVISGTFTLLERTEFNSLNLVLKQVFLLHCHKPFNRELYPCYAFFDCLVKYTLKT